MARKRRHKKVAKITHRQAKIQKKKKMQRLKRDSVYQKQKGKSKITHAREEIPKEHVEVIVSTEGDYESHKIKRDK